MAGKDSGPYRELHTPWRSYWAPALAADILRWRLTGLLYKALHRGNISEETPPQHSLLDEDVDGNLCSFALCPFAQQDLCPLPPCPLALSFAQQDSPGSNNSTPIQSEEKVILVSVKAVPEHIES